MITKLDGVILLGRHSYSFIKKILIMSSIDRVLSQNNYEAITSANNPEASNPFATMLDVVSRADLVYVTKSLLVMKRIKTYETSSINHPANGYVQFYTAINSRNNLF